MADPIHGRRPLTLAYLSVGSNLGDRLANLAAGVRHLLAGGGVELAGVSAVYETAPWGKTDQPGFLNAGLAVRTTLRPRDLLARCQAAETALHRERAERWGPRTLDVDIVLYGDEVVLYPDLIVPHPRMGERAFVIVPLLELDPHLELPGGRTVASLAPDVADQEVHVAVPAAEFLRLVQAPGAPAPESDVP